MGSPGARGERAPLFLGMMRVGTREQVLLVCPQSRFRLTVVTACPVWEATSVHWSDQPWIPVPLSCVSSHDCCMLKAMDSAANPPVAFSLSIRENRLYSAPVLPPFGLCDLAGPHTALSTGEHQELRAQCLFGENR